MPNNNTLDTDRMTLVLAAPSIRNNYYAEKHEAILNFMTQYATAVTGNDNIIVIADKQTMPLLKDRLPADILLEENIEDIWMRDFTTVIPASPVHFKYLPSYFDELADAVFIQNKFRRFMDRLNLDYSDSDLILDGGNIVDNYSDAVITSNRFLEDNGLNVEEGREVLRSALGVEYVAIIPYDDELMGHADGMAMWSAKRSLLVNKYEEPFRSELLASLEQQLPSNVIITETDVIFDNSEWDGFSSACGIHLNAVVTANNIYMPVFQNALDAPIRQLIESVTDKKVHPVDATDVCEMGGSVRCLTWQLQGPNAEKLILAARND